MANSTQTNDSQLQSSHSTIASPASNKSTINPSSSSRTSKALSESLTAQAGNQSSSPKSYEHCQASDVERAQGLAGIGSWAPGFLEHVMEAEDILNGELELK